MSTGADDNEEVDAYERSMNLRSRDATIRRSTRIPVNGHGLIDGLEWRPNISWNCDCRGRKRAERRVGSIDNSLDGVSVELQKKQRDTATCLEHGATVKLHAGIFEVVALATHEGERKHASVRERTCCSLWAHHSDRA
jgi:hypothetical protein